MLEDQYKFRKNLYYKLLDNLFFNYHLLSHNLNNFIITDKILISNKNILEIGCGNGGGLINIGKNFPLSKFIGIDFSAKNIKKCKKNNTYTNINFNVDNAEHLFTCNDNSYDIVINVESSHCYENIQKFYNNVYRVLKKDGIFCYTDFAQTNSWKHLEELIINNGFELIDKNDITENVLLSSKKISEYYISKFSPYSKLPFISTIFHSFSNSPQSSSYISLDTRDTTYMMYRFIARK